MNIGELSKLLGITSVTIRHYEKIGLLKANRNKNGYRQYDAKSIEKIKFIENAKFMGFSLSEVGELFSLESKDISSIEIKQKVQSKLSDVNEKIYLLEQLKNRLVELDQVCDGSKPSSECPILENLYTLEVYKDRRAKNVKQ
ncbi:MAG: MerR family transcriptional regulator [Gammaproteobacteria bacterium]|nr:MAG: MerR family transcriptional regulator [Gammaproteobacteria bacterium]